MMENILSLVLLSSCLSLVSGDFFYAGNECRVSIKYKTGDLKDPQPLILTGTKKHMQFMYPNDDQYILRIPQGQSIYLACPGKSNSLENLGNRKEVTAVCVRNKTFSVNGAPRNFTSLTCKYMPEHNAKRLETPCLGQYRSVSIGFQLNNTFVQTFEVCFNEANHTTYYTKFHMTKNIGSYQSKFPRPYDWIAGDYYPGLNIKDLYTLKTQINTIAKILKSTEIAKTNVNKTQFLSRGHIVAKADFVYGSQQRSTFWFLNAAPQWMTFNGGNWNSIEYSVRQFAIKRGLDLDVYTGVHGQMTMMDARGKHQPLHLYYNGTRRAVPVPKFYWKIIYDPLTKRGTAFVGLNDPFIKSITKDVYICDDISSRINWVSWIPKNINLGVSYACTVNNLRKAVPTLPVLDVIDVLV